MRNQTIDIAKGIGILTVVICHNWILYNYGDEPYRIIFSFHMPLFFFISGVFFKPYLSFSKVAISKANSLLKPYFVTIFGLILINFIYNLFKKSDFDVFNALIKGLYSSTFTLDWVQLWFLSHLFAVNLFAWLLCNFAFKNVTSKTTQALAIFFIFYIGVQTLDLFWYKTFNPLGINSLLFGNDPHLLGLPFNLDILLVTTPIFLAGYMLSKQLLDFKLNYVLFFSSLMIFVLLHYQFDYTLALHARRYDQFIICTLQMICGIYLVFGLSELITKVEFLRKIMAYLGGASLFILIFHFYPQHKLTGIFQYYFPQQKLLVAIASMVASIILSVFLYEITMRVDALKKLFLLNK